MFNHHFLIDTHTHFDAPVFDSDRIRQAQTAYRSGVRHLILIGYLYQYFKRLYDTEQSLNLYTHTPSLDSTSEQLLVPTTHIALGLHPFYIEQHTEQHLLMMAQILDDRRPIAIGEIGLDTFTTAMKQPEIFAKQQQFFSAQLDMAVTHELPVMLHIRKAHAETLALLKAHAYNAHKLGGIAHSFSGGEQEAKAFVKLGFKLGVTGQITNPNAKKLRRAIKAVVAEFGIGCLVIETDCPDMTPIQCQQNDYQSTLTDSVVASSNSNNEWHSEDEHYGHNVPANLPYVLLSLSEWLEVEVEVLAKQLWQNSCDSLRVSWSYPKTYTI